MKMIPVDIRGDGLLWLINTTVFHPRGFALAVDTETGALSLLGDGTEPWRFAEGGDPSVDDLWKAAEAAFDRARAANKED
jgi:hypothetical protein